MHSALYVGDNTHVVEVSNLRDHENTLDTGATVRLEALVDRQTGEAVTGPGLTLPLVLPHVTAEPGTYRETLPAGLSAVANRWYLATLTALGSQGFRAEWQENLLAKVRRA